MGMKVVKRMWNKKDVNQDSIRQHSCRCMAGEFVAGVGAIFAVESAAAIQVGR